LFLLPSTAHAHPVLLDSSPADGESLAESPARIELWFSEPVSPSGLQVEVYDDRGARVVTSRSAVAGTQRHAQLLDGGVRVLLDDLPAFGRSVYEIRWRAVSRLDLHQLTGNVVFGVGLPATPAGTARGELPPVGETALSWVDLSATAILCGGGLLVVLLLPRVGARWDEPALDLRPVLRVVLTAGLLSMLASTLLLAEQTQAVKGAGSAWAVLDPARQLLPWAARQAAVLAVLILVAYRLRDSLRPSRAAEAGILLGLVADVSARAFGSHAQTGPFSHLVLTGHMLAALTWLGGLLILGQVTLLAVRRRRALIMQLWRAFGLVAAVCVTVMIATGLLLAGRQVETLDAGLTTPYGWALAAKLALVALALALGLGHARRLHPWLGRSRATASAGSPPRRLVLEASTGLLVVLVAASLAATPPARGPQFRPESGPVDRVTSQVDGLLVTVALRPNRVGRAVAMVDVVSSRRPAPGAVSKVSLTLGSAGPVRLEPRQVDQDGNGRWQAAVEVDASGDLPFAGSIIRSGLDPTTVGGRWVVPTGEPGTVVISDRALAPWTAIGSAVVVLLAGLAVVRLRSRRARWLGVGLKSAPPREPDRSRQLQEVSS
jgi:copper transport protein